MNFYFDESGNFRVPTDIGSHAVGIVSGVVIPESLQPEIFSQFDNFVRTLPSSAFKQGEPKGKLLDDDGLKRFADLIFDMPPGLLFCPIMLDLTTLIGRPESEASRTVSERLESLIPKCKHDSLKQQIRDLVAQVSRMSDQQVLRLKAWALCINRCINDSIIFHSRRQYDSCWSSMHFEIDPVQQGEGTEEMSLRFLLPSWITAWSVANPMTIIEEIHTADHPFVMAWDTGKGIDVGKMFKGNIHYTSSEVSKGIQLADMMATVVRRAVIGLATATSLQNYGFLMTKSIGQPLYASGLTFIVPSQSAEAERRYAGIADAIIAAKKSTQR